MTVAELTPTLSWNPVTILRELLTYPFMINAFRAGTIVAIAAGSIGWFMVLRRQAFVGHTLALVAFPGAAAATLIGISAAYGYFGFCIVAALILAAVPASRGRGYSDESAATGILQAFALASGFLFIALYKGFLNGVNALLFGSFLGITTQQVRSLLGVAVVALAVLALIGRPLLFASIDPQVAAARGVPVRGLAITFLLLLGVAAAETSQITGALLVFALLVMPAATAQLLTARPALSLALSVLIAVAVTWLGLAMAYYSTYPTGFYVTSLAFAAYVVAWAAESAGSRLRRYARARG